MLDRWIDFPEFSCGPKSSYSLVVTLKKPFLRLLIGLDKIGKIWYISGLRKRTTIELLLLRFSVIGRRIRENEKGSC